MEQEKIFYYAFRHVTDEGPKTEWDYRATTLPENANLEEEAEALSDWDASFVLARESVGADRTEVKFVLTPPLWWAEQQVGIHQHAIYVHETAKEHYVALMEEIKNETKVL